MSNAKYETIFGNFFDNKNITSPRLLNFGDDATGRLAADNGDGRFTGILNNMTTTGNDLRSEVSDVDVAITLQKGATLTTDKVLSGFQFTMSSGEGAIAYALGGRDTPAYLQFYPKGMSEYAQATKTQMPTLTERVFIAANANKPALPGSLYNTLTIYKDGWANARTDQELKKGTVADDRGERDTNRVAYELALLQAIHLVAGLYPGDIDRGRQYFNFSILFSNAKHVHQTTSGALAAAEQKVALNRVFTSVAKLTVRNTDDDASFTVWFGAAANETQPADAMEIKVGEEKELKPLAMGNSTQKPLLLIKNLSEINVCDYEIETVG